MEDFLLIEAADSSGEEGQHKPKVTGHAYGGGKMSLPGWKHPVVVDLAGMTLPDEIPLLTNHQNKTDARVGLISATVKNGALEIEGKIVSGSKDALDIVEQSKAGADWQLSIGADVKECELVKGSREINGQMHTGPLYHIKKAILREVSVVAVGADITTRMKVAACFNLTPPNNNGENMENENQNPKTTEITAAASVAAPALSAAPVAAPAAPAAPVAATAAPPAPAPAPAKKEPEKAPEAEKSKPPKAPAAEAACGDDEKKARAAAVPPTIQASAVPADITATAREAALSAVRAERERVSSIQEICNGEFPEIEREAISAGWTPETVTQKVLATIRAERPGADVGIIVKSKPEGDTMRQTLEAAMCLRVGVPADELTKSMGEQAVEAGMAEMDMPVKQLLLECMRLEGMAVPHTLDNQTIRAAFSTVSLPGILSNVANKKLLQSYQAQPVIATKLCTEGDLSDFKETDRFRLTDVGDLLPIAADGEIKEGGLVEEGAKNQIDTYGKKFCLTRKMIINDDLGAFMKVPVGMGNRAARLIDQLFFSRLLKNPVQLDGKALFSAAHKNILNGASSALSAESLKKAIQLFLDQVDADNQPISVEPRILLVPTALKHLAIELTQGATLIMAGGQDNILRPSMNVLSQENLQVVSSPYLANSAYEGASAASWYLFGDKRQVDTFEIGYLKGHRTPTVERGETDFNTLGLWFRVYFDIGVREQDHRGMVKANGQA